MVKVEWCRWIKVNRAILVNANTFLVPLGAFLLWLCSLKSINIRQMSDLGLVSVMSPVTIVALAKALLASRKFRQIYSNPDAQILVFTGEVKERSL